MAGASSLATGSAAACGENWRIEAAAATSVPRIRLTMRRASIGVIRRCLSCARVRGASSTAESLFAFMKCPVPYSAAPSATVVLDVALEGPRRSELAELVADHRLGDEHRDVLAAVVHGDRVPEHVGDDRRTARPGLDDGLGALVVGDIHLFEQVVIDERALFETAWHLLSSLLSSRDWWIRRGCQLRSSLLATLAATADDQLVAGLVRPAGPTF